MRSSCASLSVLPNCSIGTTFGSGAAGELGRGTLERLRFTTMGLGDESLSSITTTRFFRRLTTTTGERSASCSGVAEELLSLLDCWRFFLGRAAFDCTPASCDCFAGGSAASADCFAIVFLLRDPGGRPGLRLGFGAHERSTTGGVSSTGSQALSGISSSTVGSAADIYICIFLSVTWSGEDHLEADLVIIETHDVALEVSDSEAEMLQHSVCAIH